VNFRKIHRLWVYYPVKEFINIITERDRKVIIKKIVLWIGDIIWNRIVGGYAIKASWKARSAEAVKTIVKLFPEDEPHIIDGTWVWNSNPFFISLMLPEARVAVTVCPPTVGSWEVCKIYCKNRKEWEKDNKEASSLIDMCRRINIGLISIHWGDPIDVASLGNKLAEVQKGAQHGSL
jgi:hypothetical protein